MRVSDARSFADFGYLRRVPKVQPLTPPRTLKFWKDEENCSFLLNTAHTASASGFIGIQRHVLHNYTLNCPLSQLCERGKLQSVSKLCIESPFWLTSNRYEQNEDIEYHQAKQECCCRKVCCDCLEDTINNAVPRSVCKTTRPAVYKLADLRKGMIHRVCNS